MNFSSTFRILHISDLHFGRQFNKPLWDYFTTLAKNLAPHLVVVTGDLVDTPVRRQLKKAKGALDNLLAEIKANGGADTCALLVIPGNHDTRLTGLIPVSRRLTLVTMAVLSAAGYGVTQWLIPGPWWVKGFLLTILLIALVLLTLLDPFSTHFPPLQKPKRYHANGVTVEVYPFDSASHAYWAASGRVPLEDFVKAGLPPEAVDAASEPFSSDGYIYRVGVVHHHPLPVPYDDAAEATMVLANAGALLAEASKLDIRLILHGHRHHRHFGRVILRADRPEPLEVAVLAAGTLTRGRTVPERYGNSFNIIDIDSVGHAQVTPYEAAGGTFEAGPRFAVEPIEQTVQRLRRAAHEQYSLHARALVAETVLSSNGSAKERLEYYDFQVFRSTEGVDRLPTDSIAELFEHGHIEGFRAGSLDGLAPPRLRLDLHHAGQRLTSQKGRVVFGRNVYRDDPPFSFFTEFHAMNGYAMSGQQFRARYGANAAPPVEYSQVTTPAFPVDELQFVVRLPQSFRLRGSPQLLVESPSQQRLSLLEQAYRRALWYVPETGTIHLHVSQPPPGTIFKIEWVLTDDPPPSGRLINVLVGETKELQRGLLAIWEVDETTRANRWTERQRLLAFLDQQMRQEPYAQGPDIDPWELSIMVLDPATATLRIVAATFPPGDPRARFTLAFGDGIAGLAYRMNAIKLFVKAEAERSGAPYGYYPCPPHPDQPPIPNPNLIDFEALLSVPLSHPDHADLLYGVLNIGSRRPSTRLAAYPAQELTGDFFYALNGFCFDELRKLVGEFP